MVLVMPNNDLADSATSNPEWFATTHWSVVLSAGELNSVKGSQALEKLCRAYWPPIYSYVRRMGYRTEDAQDLTQAFFAKLLEKNFWARANPEKGRFRSFLLVVLRQFLADERDRARTAKRGGGAPLISLDEGVVEGEFLKADQNLSGEQQFDGQWASTVLNQARARLRQECVDSGKLDLYERVNLLGEKEERSVTYDDIARELDTSVSAIKSAVLRLRGRYAGLVREEVAQTVSSPGEVDAEIGYLLSIIGK